jgi:urea transport system permease protein
MATGTNLAGARRLMLLRIALHARIILGLLPILFARDQVWGAVVEPVVTPQQIVVRAIIAPAAEQHEIILSLKEHPTEEVAILLERWREGGIFLAEDPDGEITPVLLKGTPDAQGSYESTRLIDGATLVDAQGNVIRIHPEETEFADTSSRLRRAIKEVCDLAALFHPDPAKRIRSVRDSAIGQNPEKLPALEALQHREKEPAVLRALAESISIIHLKSPDPGQRLAACETLGSIQSISARDTLRDYAARALADQDKAGAAAAQHAITRIDSHIAFINASGTAFRGLSLGSVLLVVAIGLAITFGLMGIINMAHGELIAVGAYTTYLMQHLLAEGLALSPFGLSLDIPGMHLTSAPQLYFVVALPASFLAAALVGLFLERSIIRFLYRRPLESLLATWGISLVLQQLFRLIFGSNNVQVASPDWLSGNWTFHDIVFGWNRVFVIVFAILIIFSTWFIMNKTSWGLLIRAVMQNRNMAACMGIRTERVNMLTFSFGCGLAGLAGAFLSQIGNVGPSLGQNYIVDAFMTVVVGGVGNIMGTVISALGIGVADQTLQQYLGNPVTGKIIVLAAIILFLQWRPAGLFVTKSRSLD